MGAHFFNLAFGKKAVPREWIRSVYAPKHLVGGHLTGLKVGMLRILREGTAWAEGAGTGILYESPDMELTSKWLEERYMGQAEVTLSGSELGVGSEPAQRISFLAGYPLETTEMIAEQWTRIKVG
jgi:hypothetical protein